MEIKTPRTKEELFIYLETNKNLNVVGGTVINKNEIEYIPEKQQYKWTHNNSTMHFENWQILHFIPREEYSESEAMKIVLERELFWNEENCCE